ncbi:hypothetical protein ARMGADRAFT_1093478 [Armillaria gallica]|uniref:Uncharacterized protein n=1 Tax=Armillaria gallica TaxID=47427 RepID=A0A2H3CUW2_ARMGA|nr:hypothetical protein ARMGADRAFT_1093478 [Armillaria gallica]
MSSHSSHHRPTSTHPYPYQIEEPRQSTSTLASSVVLKKMFLGRWKSTFKKETMEALPEQVAKDPPAIPPIQHDPLLPLMQQTWQDTSYDSAWVNMAQQGPQFQTNLPAAVLGFHQPAPCSGSMSFGITSTFHTPPFSPEDATLTNQGRLTRTTPPSCAGMSPYRLPDDLPLPQGESHQTSSRSKQRAQPRQGLLHLDPQGEPDRQGKISTGQGQTGTRSPVQPSESGTNWQKSKSLMQSLKEEPLPLLSASQEAAPQGTSSMETHGGVTSPPPPPPCQPMPLTLGRALYLLSTGRLTTTPEILYRALIIDLFNYFTQELTEDPDWAETPAGMDYTHYGYSYILKEEARHFTCVTWNMIHLNQNIEVPAPTNNHCQTFHQLQAPLS